MRNRSQTFNNIPVDAVGSNTYGRYPKISVSETINMIVSDDWLVPYAGFKLAIANIDPNGKGRGIYKSAKLNRMFLAIGNGVYIINPNLTFSFIGQLQTFDGDVFFAEDNLNNIQICDKHLIYNYNTLTNLFTTLILNFRPGYIAFHDARFISVDLDHSEWRLSDPSTQNQTYPSTAAFVGGFDTKPDIPLAAFPIPGKGNNIIILGSTVGQYWTDVGFTRFPYQLNAGINIDYGLANSDTVANLDNYVAWVGINDRSGPVIMISKGGEVQHISNDGIDFKLASLTNPNDAHGFMFKQDGHIFYQVTFKADNYTLAFDFNTGKFYTITDTFLNYHPAKGVAFFNNTYYFVSLNDGSLYEMSTNDTMYDNNEIPRIRICSTFRMPDTAPFVVNNIALPIEQGVEGTAFNPQFNQTAYITTEDNTYITTELDSQYLTTEPDLAVYSTSIAAQNPPFMAVDLAISNDGGYVFSNFDRMILNPIGIRRNRFIYYNLGYCNEFTPQFRFVGKGRFVVGNGTMSVYQ